MPNPRIGGKAACHKQHELRGRLLARADVREVDLTVSDFDWKAVLKSLPAGADVVGTAVCKLMFRLLRDVRDPNYIKIDSGERHVFEVTRTDGSVVHLHFHKNGKCDKPEMFDTIPFEIGAGEPDRMKTRLALACPATCDDIVHMRGRRAAICQWAGTKQQWRWRAYCMLCKEGRRFKL